MLMKIATIILLAASVCSIFAGPDEPLAEAAQNEFGGSGAYGCSDTVAKAAALGVNYKSLVDATLGQNKKLQSIAFGLFAWLSENAGFDAASSQGHAAVTGLLLRKLGDAHFSALSALQPEKVRKALARDICYDLGMLDNFNDERKEARAAYPETIKTLAIEQWLQTYDKQP